MKLGFRWTVVTVVGALFGTILVAAPTSAHPCTVDLKIFDGQKDTSALPDDKEEERGALTVLNRNDTDKNGDKDSTQDSVPGEIDLMKLKLEETSPTSEIAWLGVGGTDKVKLWTSPTKGGARSAR